MSWRELIRDSFPMKNENWRSFLWHYNLLINEKIHFITNITIHQTCYIVFKSFLEWTHEQNQDFFFLKKIKNPGHVLMYVVLVLLCLWKWILMKPKWPRKIYRAAAGQLNCNFLQETSSNLLEMAFKTLNSKCLSVQLKQTKNYNNELHQSIASYCIFQQIKSCYPIINSFFNTVSICHI